MVLAISWDDLPAEIRRMILQTLVEGTTSKKGYPLTKCATVCREWQEVIEEANFASLQVSSIDLFQLDVKMRGRRRRWLKRLSLKVELPKYPRRLAHSPETHEEQENNDIAFTRGVWGLFQTLSNWGNDADGAYGGLALELSAHSPSDRKVLFGEAGVTEEGDSRFFDSDLGFMIDKAGVEPMGRCGFPEVAVVSSFSILRRTYRNVSAGALATILECLPKVTEFRYEPWQQFDLDGEDMRNQYLAGVLHQFPSTIKRMSIYEGIDNFANWGDDDWFEEQEGRFLNHGLRRFSLQLEEFSLSNLVDAEDFLRPFSDTFPASARSPSGLQLPLWEHLRWLTLTSRTITSTNEQSDQELEDGFMDDAINDLLHTAGKAAKRMPQLEVMELYSADATTAGVFCFIVSSESQSATISWASTWTFDLGHAVKTVWQEVALQRTGRPLEILPEDFIDYRGPARFIHQHLATREMVLDQTSSQDMMRKQNIPPAALKLRPLQKSAAARAAAAAAAATSAVDSLAGQLSKHDYYRLRTTQDADQISSLLERFGWTKKSPVSTL